MFYEEKSKNCHHFIDNGIYVNGAGLLLVAI